MYTAAGKTDVESRITEFAPLVRKMAYHFAQRLPASVQIDDIIQAGLIGLMDAANKFEESQGNRFETYATQRIRGAMIDELRENDWLPRSLRRSMRQIDGAIHKLEQRHGRAPTETEIARELGISLADYQVQLQDAKGHQIVHLSDFGDEAGDDYLERNQPDARDDPLERLSDARFRAALVDAIKLLPEREKLLMSLYYEQDMNFKEIGQVLGVSESRVCQLHGQAIARLRSRLREWHAGELG